MHMEHGHSLSLMYIFLTLSLSTCQPFFSFQEEVPIVNFVATGIIRCRRCRTYVNPYVTFTDGGRKWRCNICSLLNDGKFAAKYQHKRIYLLFESVLGKFFFYC